MISDDRLQEVFEQREDEEGRRQRRTERLARMRQEKEQRERLNLLIGKYGKYAVCALAAAVVVITGVLTLAGRKPPEGEEPSESRREVLTALEEDALTDTASQAKPRDGAVRRCAFYTEASPEEGRGIPGGIEKVVPQELPTPLGAVPQAVDGRVQVDNVQFLAGLEAHVTPATLTVGEPVIGSEYAILVNESNNEIVAHRRAQERINPASMTKILTVLVAAERVVNPDDTMTITIEMTDYAYVNDCSAAGFSVGETVTVRDLFYGTILPSGGDAAIALAEYVAGSQEAFVELMNEKLEELGLSKTAHFTNCVGLYDENHYCTVYDMSVILKAAVENDWCRQVLSAHTYTTSSTPEHPEGITISNWFLRRIEDRENGGEVVAGKTGFVNESKNCAASYFLSDDGVPYICVTAGALNHWKCIADHTALYSAYTQ